MSLEKLNFNIVLRINRCAHELYRRRDKNSGTRACPACNKVLISRIHLCGDVVAGTMADPTAIETNHATATLNANNTNGVRSIYRSNLSLASLSLRASSLTINSECHATSSV